jgi:hypothetical protein
MNAEMQSHRENKTWSSKVNNLPAGMKAIGYRWVFVKKLDMFGKIAKFKARLVAKGYNQRHGVDYLETYAPVCKFKSIRTLMAIAASKKYQITQDDVKTAFLHSDLEIGMWMKNPEGQGFVYLEKALYGLKQAPLEWNETLNAYLVESGFSRSSADHCIYTKAIEGHTYYVGVYVDDLLTVGKDTAHIENIRASFRKRFKMSGGGNAEWYLSMNIEQAEDFSITLNQSQYIKQKLFEFKDFLGHESKQCKSPLAPNFQEKLLEAENSQDYEPEFPYRSMVGSAMFAMLGTRFDIATAVSVVSGFLDKPKKIHCEMVRQIFWYLRGTMDHKLHYKANSDLKLTGYVDASYANGAGYRSMSGHGFKLGDCLISWYSTRQSIVALSTMESEYIALTPAVQEVIWLKQLLEDLGCPQNTITLYEDNQACIKLSFNPQQNHKRSRHIQVRFHWVKDMLKDKVFRLEYCKTNSQLADVFTKGYFGQQMKTSREALGLLPDSGGKSRMDSGSS